jgi:uncharacterized protein (TIGR00296 family)
MNPYVLLARQAVENYIREKKINPLPDGLPKEFYSRKAGVFVTIMKDNELRGCIGTYSPTKENIAEEIVQNAIAATEDRRFDPIDEKELSKLSYAVYVLNKPELVKDIKELDPQKYGIIVKAQSFSPASDVIFNPSPGLSQKSGLLLPDLEGVDTVEKQITIACQKGGIDPAQEQILIYKFSVEKYQ